ncbi:MAG: YqaA family protein [Fidelibacterota bacterium]
MKWLKKLYDWVLSWADSPHGSLMLFILAFAEASFFPVPPDVLLIALALGKRRRALYFALIASLGSIFGGMAGYGIGHFSWWTQPGEFSALADFFFRNIPGFTVALFTRIQELYETWNFWVIFTAGFTPIPYKVFTISAGAFDISFSLFLLASVISRSARFFLVAGLIWKFGRPIRTFIDRWFNILVFLLMGLIIGGFLVIKLFI